MTSEHARRMMQAPFLQSNIMRAIRQKHGDFTTIFLDAHDEMGWIPEPRKFLKLCNINNEEMIDWLRGKKEEKEVYIAFYRKFLKRIPTYTLAKVISTSLNREDRVIFDWTLGKAKGVYYKRLRQTRGI